DVPDDEVVDDRRLRGVDHPDAAARCARAETAGHVARDDVRPQHDAAGGEQRHAAAVGEPAVFGDDVLDQLGGRVAADVDAESGGAATGVHEVPRDRVALNQRRAEVVVDPGARAGAVVDDRIADDARRRILDQHAAATEAVQPVANREPTQDRAAILAGRKRHDRAAAAAVD